MFSLQKKWLSVQQLCFQRNYTKTYVQFSRDVGTMSGIRKLSLLLPIPRQHRRGSFWSQDAGLCFAWYPEYQQGSHQGSFLGSEPRLQCCVSCSAFYLSTHIACQVFSHALTHMILTVPTLPFNKPENSTSDRTHSGWFGKTREFLEKQQDTFHHPSQTSRALWRWILMFSCRLPSP